MPLRSTTRKCVSESDGCTCDGGPYTHGPKGRDEILAAMKKRKEQENNEPGTPVRETRTSGP